MFSFIRIAFRNVFLAKRRTLLLGLSLFLVSMIFILLNALSAGITERMIDSATTLSSGHINVGGFFKPTTRGAVPLVSDKERIKGIVHKLIPEARMIDRGRGWGRVVGPESSINCGLVGIEYQQEHNLFSKISLASEKEYLVNGKDEVLGSFKDMEKKDSILIFASQAKKLGVGIGDTLTIVKEASGGQGNSLDFTVAAIGKDIGLSTNWMVFISHEAMNSLYNLKEDTTGAVMLYLPKIEDAEAKMGELRTGLVKEGFELMDYDPNPFFFKFNKVMGEDWLGQKLELTLWKDEISYLMWVTSAIELITLLIIAILSFIIASGIANTMWLSVRERIKEIGTMRAFGAQKEQILFIFVMEAFFLGVFFVGAGALFSTLLIYILNSLAIPIHSDGIKMFLMTQSLHFSMSPLLFIKTIFVFSIVAMAGAFFPAIRAARLKPVDALRQGK